jgi:UDP-N-acetylmuramoylalanine--D-glutamate ligase
VRFVNDSKATNLAALRAAVLMTPPPIRLIAGGLLKEDPTAAAGLKELLSTKVRKVYLIGRAAQALETAWRDHVACAPCGRLEAAVRAAWADASDGETILLAPACASFDQFRGFDDRGEQFTRLAQALARGET